MTPSRMQGWGAGFVVVLAAGSFASFVNWESAHVHPLDRTPDGAKLLAVNTADNRLEVFDVSTGRPVWIGSVPVGLDPVTVRARTNTEAWVVNRISDSVSIVNLATMNVIRTIPTDDEPADVVFAGSPPRAFVSCSRSGTVLVMDALNPSPEIRNLDQIPGGPDPILPLPFTIRVPIVGPAPRMMAVSADGSQVFVAIFESGNRSTILGGGDQSGGMLFAPNVVDDPLSPYFNPDQPFALGINPPNPPPNSGTLFFPPIAPGLPPPPRVGLIVKKDSEGRWMDDNQHDWTDLVSGENASHSRRPVGWDLFDHDVAVINASTLGIRYMGGLMNICMALAVHPVSGRVSVVGTDGTNEVRFEPVLAGRFLRVQLGSFNPDGPADKAIVDLNPNLAYDAAVPFVPIHPILRARSIGDPRGIVWNTEGDLGYVTGMGSNNLIVIDEDGAREQVEPIVVGEGPTGLVLDEMRGRLFVLNKFEATISVVDTESRTEILPRVPLFDPTPPAIKTGRKHLYDTHLHSGLGHVSCASCHVDARSDRLGWDLGNPQGTVKPFNQNCNGVPGAACQPWHPMKGPMVTQTLQDIIGHEPHHWRADRDGIEEFAAAFQDLLGAAGPLPEDAMQEFEDFLATIHFPPNPFRNFNNTLPLDLPLPGHFSTGRFAGAGGLPAGAPLPNGNAARGLQLYRQPGMDGGLACVTCHTLPTGMGMDGVFMGNQFVPLPTGPNGEHHHMVTSADGSTNRTMKVAHLRNMHEKTGFDTTQLRNIAGFGFLHDGSVDSLARFISLPAFNIISDQDVADLVAFMLAFSGSDLPPGNPNNPLEPPGPPSKDTHAAVGRQVTIAAMPAVGSPQAMRIGQMLQLANNGAVGLVAKGRLEGEARGWTYVGMGVWQSDRFAEQITHNSLQGLASAGSELTFTVVPEGSQNRIGVDRDEDGYLDRDELDHCGDPADPAVVPAACPLHGDVAVPYCIVDVGDVLYILNAYGDPDPCVGYPQADISPCDTPCSLVDLSDVLSVLAAYSGNYECANVCPQWPG